MSCLPPSGMNPPRLKSVYRTNFTIEWDIPQSDGGCPITGYDIFRDDGAGGLVVIPVDPISVDDNPYLFMHTTNMTPADTGNIFRIKIEANNVYG